MNKIMKSHIQATKMRVAWRTFQDRVRRLVTQEELQQDTLVGLCLAWEHLRVLSGELEEVTRAGYALTSLL